MQAALVVCVGSVVKMMMRKEKKIKKKGKKKKTISHKCTWSTKLRLNAGKQKAHYSYANQESRFRAPNTKPLTQPKP